MLTTRSGRVREARKLTRRQGRLGSGLFLAEGPQAIREALGAVSGGAIELFVSPDAAVRWADLVDQATSVGITIHQADDAALASLSETVTPQGLVAVCRSVTVELTEAVPQGARLVTLLAEIRDPGNAGTVIRCSDAAGADGVVLTRGSVDPQGGKCVRASAGSLFHLPVATDVALPAAIAEIRRQGLTVLAADGAGSIDLERASGAGLLARPTAWLFGNEAWGLPDAVRELADEIVRVPIYGRAESLNLATASAVCLYASARVQRAA